MMRAFATCALLALMGAVPPTALAAEPLAVTRLEWAGPAGNVPDIACPKRVRPPAPRPQPEEEPLVIPDESEVRQALEVESGAGTQPPGGAAPLPLADRTRFRVALWGDSHVAAGFFSEELVRQLGADADATQPAFLPAAFRRPGVRLPVRESCVSGGWRYEHAYYTPASAARPGPGLVSMASSEPGSWLAVDLRGKETARPASRWVRILLDPGEPPLRLRIAVNGLEPQDLLLDAASGPTAIELVSAAGIATVRIELLEGRLRLQGLSREVQEQAPVRIETFGYPGATANGWAQADTEYLRPWFAQAQFDVVALAFGTNEGNVKQLNADAYREMVRSAVRNLKAVFPSSACLLIGPGDRGVLVRKRKVVTRKGSTKATRAVRSPAAAPAAKANPALLAFSKVHEEIARIQREVAQESGCHAWSAFDSMGGRASAYTWARTQPALMAPDLLHFTVKGYQKLAQQMSAELGWARR